MPKHKKFYVTTPIYYVNDSPHVGSAYTTVIADIIARWHRLKNEDVFFLTGLDENSQKTVQASIKLGFSDIQKYADYMAEKWKETFKKLNISNNDRNLSNKFFNRTIDFLHNFLVTDIK